MARSAAWAAPVLVTSVAAPAYAASGACLGGAASLSLGSQPVLLTFPPSPVTATVSFATTGWGGNLTPGDTGEVHATSYSPSWNYIKLHHADESPWSQGDTITMTLTFSRPVQNLSLTVTDIDQDVDEWIDHVIISQAAAYTFVAGSNVRGSGTSADPFRPRNNGGISNATGDVKLTWAGPVSQVQITYRAADLNNGSAIGQHIGVGLIGFGPC